MENEAVYTEKYKNCLIKIYQDENTQSPSEWDDNSIFLIGYHRDFYVKNDNVITEDEAKAIANGEENGRSKDIEKEYFTFGLEAYIHSGVSLSLSNEGNYPDRQWDVSQLGMVLVSKKEAKTKEKARKLALGLIETWNQYLSGEVYGFITENENNGMMIESVWGFYGDFNNSGIITEAKNSIDYYIKKERKDAKIKKEDFSRKSLGELLSSDNEGIKRNAIGILKQLQKS